MKVYELEKEFEAVAPTYLKEDYDNVGLMIGDTEAEIENILVALDCTKEVISEAKEMNCQMIYSHHPLLFRKPSSITTKTLLGTKIIELIKNDIALYSAHTNLDSVEQGINDSLVKLLGFESGIVMDLNRKAMAKGYECGIGRLIELETPITLKELLERINTNFSDAPIRYSGTLEKEIKVIAVINGSGMDFFQRAKELGADAIITGDTTYHFVSDYTEEDIAIIDMEHFYSEWQGLKLVAKTIEEKLKDKKVNIIISEKSKSPYKIFKT
ncbi:Nif3-like dinuclear metal center hexameric protein [Clostridium cellulovorans]|uniref:GTP cyclohydrolase 1 type 2 homolog n=1 Tax=Clostridium cellulovorans (strain ATCC 35296 / DSM 3052 / OCM 3 / 743B) TaxID=573061 RepID=D9SW70_CLOC7|nr:Nif3-like dinuclear metal center hexameric protein [Clostridium cellulovorans]ADL51214.1 protein of unknown function DUF34 [Clostridium cellulovorans 743B]